MRKAEIIQKLIPSKLKAKHQNASAFAPSNIALCKYWGKRDTELNLPFNSSLSISLGNKGALTKISIHDGDKDIIVLNKKIIDMSLPFAQKILEFVNLFRQHQPIFLRIETDINIPVAAGVASSACGFAALVKALNNLFAWQLDDKSLSILARLGSGSACRSLWDGFVEWRMGAENNGMDSYGYLLPEKWNELQIGLLIFSSKEKSISSRDAMQQTVNTSAFYKTWLNKVNDDLIKIKQAIAQRDFNQLGSIAESDALAMHATMLTSWPPTYFSLPETIATMHKIWELRKAGLDLYFTQDAGPNLKLLFLEKDKKIVKENFSAVEIISPFGAA